jgi:hypothetical protein
VIYPNDHRPAYAHLIGADREAVFNLGCPHGPAVLRENYGCTQKELATIGAELSADLAALCEAWRTIHGNP